LTPGGTLIVAAHQTDRVTVWLSPELVPFDKPIEVEVNNRQLTRGRLIPPDLSVLLEDVRTRADRQHPFWAKLTWP
jgi:hypothetical protein